MIFAASTDDRTMIAFSSEAEAVAHCEGLDVEAGGWLFWDGAGAPLEAEFLIPNTRGLLLVQSGQYRLVRGAETHHALLAESVDEIAHFQGPSPATSAEAVREHLLHVSRSMRGRGEI